MDTKVIVFVRFIFFDTCTGTYCQTLVWTTAKRRLPN